MQQFLIQTNIFVYKVLTNSKKSEFAITVLQLKNKYFSILLLNSLINNPTQLLFYLGHLLSLFYCLMILLTRQELLKIKYWRFKDLFHFFEMCKVCFVFYYNLKNNVLLWKIVEWGISKRASVKNLYRKFSVKH